MKTARSSCNAGHFNVEIDLPGLEEMALESAKSAGISRLPA
jgi:S-adenosylhomocysteine hydrolase